MSRQAAALELTDIHGARIALDAPPHAANRLTDPATRRTVGIPAAVFGLE